MKDFPVTYYDHDIQNFYDVTNSTKFLKMYLRATNKKSAHLNMKDMTNYLISEVFNPVMRLYN